MKSSSKPVTPYELVHGEVPAVSNIRRFGSLVYTHIPRKLRGENLEAAAYEGILVGFYSILIYRVSNPELGKLKLSRDIKIEEDIAPECLEG